MRPRAKGLAILATAILLAGLVTASAQAGCNEIPASGGLLRDAAELEAIQSSIPKDLPYLGRSGRINLSVAVPGVTEKLLLGPDLTCSPGEISAFAGPSGPSSETLAALLMIQRADGEEADLRLYASQKNCPKILASAAPARVAGCESAGFVVRPHEEADGRASYRVELPFPGTGNLPSGEAGASRQPGAGSVKVAVFPAGQPGIQELAGALGEGGCESTIGPFDRSHEGYICIDSFLDGFAPCGIRFALDNAVPCEFTVSGPANDFARQSGETPTHLRFIVDSCGGVHIPFYWKDAFPENGLPEGVYLKVEGESGAATKEPASDDQIRLPGREFVGSTNPEDEGLDNWRRPEVTVEDPRGEKLLKLSGTVDQENSVVHIYPRLPVSQICVSQTSQLEGCLAVEQGEEEGKEKCACEDIQEECDCKSTSPAKYFACEGDSDFEGMPCTRPSHCGSGRCTGQPTCQLPGTIWREGDNPVGPKNCRTDRDCEELRDTTGETECGYSFFDFRDRVRDDEELAGADRPRKGPVKLFSRIRWTGAGQPARRGVCSKEKDKECRRRWTGSCHLTAGDCQGYELRALGTTAP